ncbi:hypothetical protein [Aquincola sp. J276]|uniref:hypothetical protein n=1 Tax=Aquincola sp. J276 TaxID=2898432 RepID=UPI00215143AE|nr:hypothetical protein [Aquincola sp. J276]MCR5865683.1 hypothetical protein [Aquincola sp. J276]
MQTQYNNIDFTHVIVLDSATWTVFGTGRTEDEALEDAAQWNEGSTRGLTCYDATEAAFEHAKAHGADASALQISERPNRIDLAA